MKSLKFIEYYTAGLLFYIFILLGVNVGMIIEHTNFYAPADSAFQYYIFYIIFNIIYLIQLIFYFNIVGEKFGEKYREEVLEMEESKYLINQQDEISEETNQLLEKHQNGFKRSLRLIGIQHLFIFFPAMLFSISSPALTLIPDIMIGFAVLLSVLIVVLMGYYIKTIPQIRKLAIIIILIQIPLAITYFNLDTMVGTIFVPGNMSGNIYQPRDSLVPQYQFQIRYIGFYIFSLVYLYPLFVVIYWLISSYSKNDD